MNKGAGATALVLGILSLVMCPCLGIFAWLYGSARLNKKDFPEKDYGLVKAGTILGMIATLLLLLLVILAINGYQVEKRQREQEQEMFERTLRDAGFDFPSD